MLAVLTVSAELNIHSGAGQWADHRGTLDFNLLKGDWPDALPAADGNGFPRWAVQPQPEPELLDGLPSVLPCLAYSTCFFPLTACPACYCNLCRSGAFAALKEGQSWHDPATRLLLSFEAIGGCPGTPGLPLYNHSGELVGRAEVCALCLHDHPTALGHCSSHLRLS